jgi:hypothetical protein
MDSISATVILREHGWNDYGFLGADPSTNRRDIVDFLTQSNDQVIADISEYLNATGNLPNIPHSKNALPNQVRVFITHLDQHKQVASQLKSALELEGLNGFVAHQDITDSAPWREFLQSELQSCDAFVVLVTEGIENSVWCQQEIGWAISRRIPVIPIKFETGVANLGFLADIQFMTYGLGGFADISKRILEVLARNSSTHERIRSSDFELFAASYSCNRTRALWARLKKWLPFSDHEKSIIRDAFTKNPQVKETVVDNRNLIDIVEEFLSSN